MRGKVLEGLNAAFEGFGYAIGEAEDFLSREEPRFCDLIDDVAEGKITPRQAKQTVHEVMGRAADDLNKWRVMRAYDADWSGFPHLHDSLRPENLRFRVVARLPEGVA